MITPKRQIGNTSEQLVSEFLEGKGYSIVARNYSCSFGEIDILALSKDNVLCAVEVKTLSSRWAAEDIGLLVDIRKQIRIKKALSHYLEFSEVPGSTSIRFDVAAVTDGRITYYSEAF